MCDADVFAVYERLKDTYSLVITTTTALDDGFTVDCPILVGKAHGQMLYLYACEGDFVLDVMGAEQTKGTHWHPISIEDAVEDVAQFMDGRSDYLMSPFA